MYMYMYAENLVPKPRHSDTYMYTVHTTIGLAQLSDTYMYTVHITTELIQLTHVHLYVKMQIP